MSLLEAQTTLVELADVLADWHQRLSALRATIPDPVFEPGTDRPLNEAARVLATIDSMLLERITKVERDARAAAGAGGAGTPETALPGRGDDRHPNAEG
jgi:hypothetical protein